jgi:hypothetical protein
MAKKTQKKMGGRKVLGTWVKKKTTNKKSIVKYSEESKKKTQGQIIEILTIFGGLKVMQQQSVSQWEKGSIDSDKVCQKKMNVHWIICFYNPLSPAF